MKKVILCICLLLTGCSNKEEVKEEFKDGTYHTTVSGYGGDFEIIGTYKDGKLVDIKVPTHQETPSIGGIVVEDMIASVTKNQSIEFDVVSGATMTSNAIIEGLKDLEKQARK